MDAVTFENMIAQDMLIETFEEGSVLLDFAIEERDSTAQHGIFHDTLFLNLVCFCRYLSIRQLLLHKWLRSASKPKFRDAVCLRLLQCLVG